MNKLVIYGEGGLGHEVLDLALQLQKAGLKSYDEILFADDNPAKTDYIGYRVMTSEAIFQAYSPSDTKFTIAIGEPAYRIKLMEKVKERGYQFETLIHPGARVGLHTSIGDGTIVQWGSFISCDCQIGENCFLQPLCSVGHNVVIDDNCIISSNAAISGGVAIGKNTYLAVAASVVQGVRIGADSVVGMGAVVARDIPDNVIALGNPARPMKNKDGSLVFKG